MSIGDPIDWSVNQAGGKKDTEIGSYPRRVVAPVAISLSTGDVILIVVIAAIPVAFASFVLGAGNALQQIGKGQFAVEFDSDLPNQVSDDAVSASPKAREAEIRQLLEAKAYRQRARGEPPLDVDAELAKLLVQPPGPGASPPIPSWREEVRQLVVARNERRLRARAGAARRRPRGRAPARELESLGQ